MKERYHEGIFYPERTTIKDDLLTAENDREEAIALLVPHQEFSRCAALIQEAFRHRGNPERVIIFSPLHGGRLESDKDDFLFEGEVLPLSRMTTLGLKQAEYYAEEEPAAELLLPFLEKNLPEASFAVVYTDVRCAREVKALASRIEKWNDGKTLFLVSSNLSETTRSAEDTERWKKAAVAALTDDGYLLDRINKNQIHLCGGGVIDAIDRVTNGRWVLVKDEEDDTVAAHASLYKEKR